MIHKFLFFYFFVMAIFLWTNNSFMVCPRIAGERTTVTPNRLIHKKKKINAENLNLDLLFHLYFPDLINFFHAYDLKYCLYVTKQLGSWLNPENILLIAEN